jgi:hypothetical protein
MEEDSVASAPPRKAAEPAPIPQESETGEGSAAPGKEEAADTSKA